MRKQRPFQQHLAALLIILVCVPSAWAGFAGTDVFVASVGHGEGAEGSQWRTTLWIYNPGSTPANCKIELLLRNQTNPAPAWYNVTIPPGDTVRYDDAIWTLFNIEGYGALRIISSHDVVVNSRIYNQEGLEISDTQGQFFSAIPSSMALGAGEDTDLLGVNQASDEDFRYNFGMVETAGHSVAVEVTLYDHDGSQLGGKTYNLLPLEAIQVGLSDIGAGSMPTENGRLFFHVRDDSEGKVIIFGSSIANTSQDPSTFEMRMTMAEPETGLESVEHDSTLEGDGTTEDPLGLADGAVTPDKIATGTVVRSLDGVQGSVDLVAGDNMLIDTDQEGHRITFSAAGTQVSHDDTLEGDGSDTNPLSLADGAVAPDKIALRTVVRSLNGIQDTVDLVAGENVTINPNPGNHRVTISASVTGTTDLTLPYSGSASSSDEVAFSVMNSGSGCEAIAILGTSTQSPGVQGAGSPGVRGQNTSSGVGVSGTSVDGTGVYGQSANGFGVEGIVTNGLATAVRGSNFGSSTKGFLGTKTVGVKGTGPTGVEGVGSDGSTGTLGSPGFGVLGESDTSSGVGVKGISVNGNWGELGSPSFGVRGVAGSSTCSGVKGEASNGNGGVIGSPSYGVFGSSVSQDGVGGQSEHQHGVHARSSGTGISGSAMFASSISGIAIWGETRSSDTVFGGVNKGTGRLINMWAGSGGEYNRFYVTNSGEVYADGGFHSFKSGYAEFMSVDGGEKDLMENGDVVAIDINGKLRRTVEAYQPTVIGVYTENAGMAIRPPENKADTDNRVPVALMGIVSVKATDENGPIRPGDLLVSSKTPGHAMRAGGKAPQGTIFGKALSPLAEGVGVIRVVLSLQ